MVYAITKISKKKFRRLHTYTAVFCVRKYEGAAVAEWLSSWLAVQEDRGSRLVISFFQVEIWLKERLIGVNPQNNQPQRKYDVTACADDVIDGSVIIKDDTTLCRCKKQWKIRRYLIVKPLSSKSEVNASKTCRFCFICIQNISGSPEDPIAMGRFPSSWISQ